MQISTFAPTDYFGSNMYIISSGDFAIVVDPSIEYKKLSEVLDKEGLSVKFVVLTHPHFDHMLEVDGWIKNTSARLIVGKEAAQALSDSTLNCYRLFFGENKGYFGEYTCVCDGEVLTIGDLSIKIIETPGHSPGSISLYFDGNVFVGDVVFAGGGVGRVDLPGGDSVKLRESINKIAALPQNTVIYSGHGPSTTVRELKNFI